MTNEKLEKSLKRLQSNKIRDIEKYRKSEFFRYIGFIALTVLLCLLAFVVIAVLMFYTWNSFNPEQDYLYFIAIYCIFGSLANIIIISIAESRIKKYGSRKRHVMSYREKQIHKYYGFLKEETMQQYRDEIEENKYYDEEDTDNTEELFDEE